MLPRRSAVWAIAAILAGCGAAETAGVSDGAADVVSDVRWDVVNDRAAPQDVLRDGGVDAAMPDIPDVADVADAPEVAAPRDVPADLPPDLPPAGPVLYPADQRHSPITPSVAAAMRAIAANGSAEPRVLAKVGASNTVNTNFLACFGGANVDLAGRDALRPTLDHFRGGRVGGSDPFQRVSLAATVGWSAWAALAGSPSPLERELDATRARYAVILFGTNDIQSRDLHRYGQNLLDIAERCAARGVIPLLTAVPPRDDNPDADLWVPRYSAVARAVAQTWQVPFIELERVLRALPDHGIGTDGLHLNVYAPGGAPRGCVLTDAGLRYGHNARNLLTLEVLDRARRALEGGPAPDADAPRLAGEGTAARPFEVPSLPFADARDTRRGGVRGIDRYAGCMSAADESGPEFVYRITVRESTRVRVLVLSRGGADLDAHLLGAQVSGAACVARHDQMLTATLAPGTWHVVVDTFVSQGSPRAGSYVLVVMRD